MPGGGHCRSLQLVKGMAHQKKQTVSFSMNPSRSPVRRRAAVETNVGQPAQQRRQISPVAVNWMEVQADVVEHTVLFCVWDKGIGIEPAELERLFQPLSSLTAAWRAAYRHRWDCRWCSVWRNCTAARQGGKCAQ
jgi:hypothetical protein